MIFCCHHQTYCAASLFPSTRREQEKCKNKILVDVVIRTCVHVNKVTYPTVVLCGSVGRAWRLQRQGCGFDSHGGPV